MLAHFPGFSAGREKAVETLTLLDHHFWLSGQGRELLATILPWQSGTWLCPSIQLAMWLSWGWPCPEKGAIPEI